MTADAGPQSVLIVSGNEKGADFIREILPKSEFYPVTAVGNAGEAKRILVQNVFDIVIVNTPLPDEFGTEFAIGLSDETYTGILLLVKSELFEQIVYAAEPYGILTVSKPIPRQALYRIVKLSAATRRRLQRLERRNESLKEKMNEIRIVNRAKWILIRERGMDEEKAHRYIEKTAMDTRSARKEIAEEIIRTYGRERS